MDGWNILLGLILFSYALPYIVGAVFCFTFIGFSIAMARKQKLVPAVILLAVAFTPALVPAALHWREKAQAEARADHVAGLERSRVEGPPPRVLVARGGLPWPSAFRLMALDAFDEVYQVGRHSGYEAWRLKSTTGCNALVTETRQAAARGALKGATLPEDFDDCLLKSPVDLGGLPESAVVLLADHESRLRPSNSLRSGSVFELRIKTPSQDALLDYWEAPDAVAKTTPPLFRKPYVPSPTLDVVSFILAAVQPTQS